jgi:hypothetical protein
MTGLLDVFDTDELLNVLDTADRGALGLGDGVAVVYDSPHSDTPQVKTGKVIGADDTRLFLKQPKEEVNGPYPRVLRLRRTGVHDDAQADELDHFPAPEYARLTDGAGYRPATDDGDLPGRNLLGDVLKVVPKDDVAASWESPDPKSPFNITEKDAVGNIRRLKYYVHGDGRETSITPRTLCTRLFEATGGAECDYTFGFPMDRYGNVDRPQMFGQMEFLDRTGVHADAWREW